MSATTPPPLNLDPGKFLLLPPPESIRAKLGLPPQMDVGPYAYVTKYLAWRTIVSYPSALCCQCKHHMSNTNIHFNEPLCCQQKHTR